MSGSWWSTAHASLRPSPDIDMAPKRHSAGNQATSSWLLPSGRIRQIAAGFAARKVRFALGDRQLSFSIEAVAKRFPFDVRGDVVEEIVRASRIEGAAGYWDA